MDDIDDPNDVDDDDDDDDNDDDNDDDDDDDDDDEDSTGKSKWTCDESECGNDYVRGYHGSNYDHFRDKCCSDRT